MASLTVSQATKTTSPSVREKNNHTYYEISIRSGPSVLLGTLRFVLYIDTVPETCSRFLKTVYDAPPQKSRFHRVIPGFMVQGGELSGQEDENLPDENFVHGHDGRGVLSSANLGRPHTNGTQFFVTFRATPHLDGRHVVFGKIDPSHDESWKVLDAIERVRTDPKTDAPKIPLVIHECKVIKATSDNAKNEKVEKAVPSSPIDKDEISLDDDSVDDEYNAENEGPLGRQTKAQRRGKENFEDDNNIEETLTNDEKVASNHQLEAEDSKPLNPLQQRLMALRMKMNQSRVLNRREVRLEGERISNDNGYKKQVAAKDKQTRREQWEQNHAKAKAACSSGSGTLVELKHLVEPASDNMRKMWKKELKAETNRFDVNDYYNPEGQHRNYERSLKSVPRHLFQESASSATVFDATDLSNVITATDTNAAQRVANEMKRRIEKSKASKKHTRLEFEGTDITYVNQRNKRFNEKINRNYDSYTAEIKQNLERGTAL